MRWDNDVAVLSDDESIGVDCGSKLKITFWILIGFPFTRSLLKTLPTVVAVVVVLSVVVTV